MERPAAAAFSNHGVAEGKPMAPEPHAWSRSAVQDCSQLAATAASQECVAVGFAVHSSWMLYDASGLRDILVCFVSLTLAYTTD
jgi:hypothetical protein